MALKLKLVIISAIYLLCNQIYETETCHLDHMKHFALNSCELLIDALKSDLNPHNERLKREIFEYRNQRNNSHYDESRHIRPTHLKIKINNFPESGYIVVDQLYAKILRHAYPSMYHRIKKMHYSHEADNNTMNNEIINRRRKRHHDDQPDNKKTINFTYCCSNHCRAYDLCEF
ncbi:hypothetical protein HA402_015236 [Bradysia odoriphaga]|nr:hypothetical protein HA402_015236 [Bradysia odoriphaga]